MSEFALTQDDFEFLCGHDLLITGIWGMAENSLAGFKQRQIPVAFDFSDQESHPIVEQAIENVTYAFFSIDKGDSQELRTFMIQMQSRGPALVVVTMGEKGSLCYDGSTFYEFGIIPCEVVDTMGAGDSYIAGFLKELMSGGNIPDCMKAGAECSKETLLYQGAWQ